jgi:hypothetical protein
MILEKVKRRKFAILIACIFVVGYIIWWAFFAPEYTIVTEAIVEIQIEKNKVCNNNKIYETRLINTDPIKDTATIEVKFPERGWKTFEVSKNERVAELGWYITRISADSITISVRYPYVSKGRLRKYLNLDKIKEFIHAL